ncbi:hypothetical protein D3C87_1363000 [compost metagenome]
MFQLSPFQNTPQTDALKISADLLRVTASEVVVTFEITGKTDLIQWPSELPLIAERRDSLWEHTCLEAFLSPSLEKSAPYVEVNCAPHGHWNCYQLSSYRHGLTPLAEGKVTLQSREQIPNGVKFVILTKGLPWSGPLHVGLTAVIEMTNGEMSYWALSHAEKEADFHSKKSFTLSI